MKTTTTARFKVLGIDRDCDTCECCGKTGLKLTVILGRIDADQNVAEVVRFGRDCAARATLLRRTGQAMEVLAAEAQRQADAEKSRRVVDLGRNDLGVLWIVESIGSNGGSVTRLCGVKNATRTEVYTWAAREFPACEINVRKAI